MLLIHADNLFLQVHTVGFWLLGGGGGALLYFHLADHILYDKKRGRKYPHNVLGMICKGESERRNVFL